MREPPVKMPPITLERRGSAGRELFFFIAAFVAVFGAALILFDIITA